VDGVHKQGQQAVPVQPDMMKMNMKKIDIATLQRTAAQGENP
jgi:hypothetical protein